MFNNDFKMVPRTTILWFSSIVLCALSSIAQVNQPLLKYSDWEQSQRSEFFRPDGKVVKGYKQFERSNLIWEKHLDNDGNMLNYASKNMDEYLQLRSTTTPTGSTWDFVGPHGPDVDNDFNTGGTGRVNCVQIFDADTWFIGSSGGGLWKTDNAGVYLPGVFDQPWENLTDNFPCLAISGIAVNPTDENEIYILTGDPFNFDLPSIGIYKTSNGGDTWESTDLEFTRNQTVYGYKLIYNPDNFLEMYACTNDGLFHTTDGWITSTQEIAGQFFDVEFHPTDSEIVYASSDDRIYKLCCGNSSFQTSDTGISESNSIRADITVTATAPDLVYAVYIGNDRSLGGIYLSVDGAETWALVLNGNLNLSASTDANDPEDNGQGEYCSVFYADPEVPAKLYYGCVNLWSSPTAGISWGQLTDWTSDDDVHADFHDLVRNPYSGSLIAATDGGIYVSSDGGDTWDNRNYGLHITEFYHLGVDNNWLITGLVAGGAQDNGTISSVAIEGAWNDQRIQGGDGFDVNLNALVDFGTEFYSESQYGNLYYTGFGALGTNSNNIYPDDAEVGIEQKTNRFDTPYKVNPYEWNEVIIGYSDLYYSNDRGDDWIKLWDSGEKITYTDQFEITNIDFPKGTIGGLTVSSSNNNSSWDDEVWVTTMLTSLIVNPNFDVWIRFTHEDLGLPTNRRISDLSIRNYIGEGPNYNSLAVCIAGYDSLNKVIYVPDLNDPDSIMNLTYDLPNVPILCIEQRNDGIYVGTDIGVFYLPFGFDTWQYHNTGLPIVPVTEIQFKETLIDGNMMYISTYGRGIWRNFLAEANPNKYFVDLDATGTNDGLSWENAFTSLTNALTIAEPQDSLWIAEGAYFPSNSRGSSFSIDGEKIFGGFNGTETNLDERNLALHITKLSGDIGTVGVATDNVYRLLVTNTADNHCQFDGITFSDGYANGTAADQKSGACLKVTTYLPTLNIHLKKRPHFENCIFENFYAQSLGGVFWHEDYNRTTYEGSDEIPEIPVIFENCLFRNNYAQNGGVIYSDNYIVIAGIPQPVLGDADFELIDCTFENNSAQYGGVISIDAQVTTVEKNFENLVFIGNSATEDGGVFRNYTANDGTIIMHFTDCSFIDNNSDDYGGAIYSYCGTNNSYNNLPGHLDFTYDNCIFSNNTATSGGGAICDEMGPGDADEGIAVGMFNNCNFESNYAGYYGGAIYADNSNSASNGNYTLNNCTFNNNDVGGEGGAIKANGAGGGHSELTLNNCNFTNSNAGAEGGAIYGEGFASGYFEINADSCLFENCAADNGGAILMRSTTSGTGTVVSNFSNIVFNANHANGPSNNSYGGAVRHYGGGTHSGSYTNCLFTANHSNMRAGAINVQNNNIAFTECDFIGNYSPSLGGALYIEHTSGAEHTVSFDSCNFELNDAAGNGGAVNVSVGSGSGYLHLPINNCLFENNEAGDGASIYVSGGGPADIDCSNTTFYSNNATSDGAGIYFVSKGTIDILNCLFDENVASAWGAALNLKSFSNDLVIHINESQFLNGDSDYAGAILIENDNFTNISAHIDQCTFTNNEADLGIGAVGIYCFDECDIEVSNCDFVGNHSLSAASGVGALYVKSNSTTDTIFVDVRDCLFESNSSVGPCGALQLASDGSEFVNVDDCIFRNNISNSNGGAIRLYTFLNDYLDVEFNNCLFDGNTSGARGGAVFSETVVSNAESYLILNQCVLVNNQAASGGAIQLHSTTLGAINNTQVLNCTIANNHATTKCGGIHAERTNGSIQANLSNNIIWGNTDADTELDQKQGFLVGLGTISMNHSDIQNGVPVSFINGPNNINADPVFLDVLNADGVDQIFGSLDDGFSIQGYSSCIDVADGTLSTAFDVANTPRPQLDGFDIGAYESLVSDQITCLGDLNNDGLVNTTDLLLFISAYGYPCAGCLADLTGDGFVNTSDLLVFVSTFGNNCTD